MSSQPRPLFDSSFAALVLVNARKGAEQPPRTRTPGRFAGGSATAMPIQFAPEPGPTAHAVELDDDQTTGPLPLGFEFEFFGVRYTLFELSSDGFMTFGTRSPLGGPECDPRSRFIPLNADLNNFMALGLTDVCPLGRRHVAYEVRGTPERHRLVLSFIPAPELPEDNRGVITAQLVLHERTGMIDLYTARPDADASSFNEEGVRFTTCLR